MHRTHTYTELLARAEVGMPGTLRATYADHSTVWSLYCIHQQHIHHPTVEGRRGMLIICVPRLQDQWPSVLERTPHSTIPTSTIADQASTAPENRGTKGHQEERRATCKRTVHTTPDRHLDPAARSWCCCDDLILAPDTSSWSEEKG